jgi:hypothetical protein
MKADWRGTRPMDDIIEDTARQALDIADESDKPLRVAATYASREAGIIRKQVDVFEKAKELDR